jgi:hypothetical protein
MENASYEEILETIVTALTERGIQEQREGNPEVETMLQEQKKLSVQARKCLETLDAGTRNTLVQYYEQAESIADEQIHYLYIQGARDCVRLLKSLGII